MGIQAFLKLLEAQSHGLSSKVPHSFDANTIGSKSSKAVPSPG